MDGLTRFGEIVAGYSALAVEKEDLTAQIVSGEQRILATRDDPARKRLLELGLKQARSRLPEVQKQQVALIAELEALQAADATVPGGMDEFDPGLAKMRTRLHMARQARKHLQDMPFSTLTVSPRSQRVRELKSEEESLVRMIRAREQKVLAAMPEAEIRG